jgi:hypothetical protein
LISSAICVAAVAEKHSRFISVSAPVVPRNLFLSGRVSRRNTGAPCSSANSVDNLAMNSSTNQQVRHAFAEFSQTIGKAVIRVRLFKEHAGYLCERELIELDGTAFTQALPFRSLNEVQEFLTCDPHYSTIQKGAKKLLDRLASEVINEFPN